MHVKIRIFYSSQFHRYLCALPLNWQHHMSKMVRWSLMWQRILNRKRSWWWARWFYLRYLRLWLWRCLIRLTDAEEVEKYLLTTIVAAHGDNTVAEAVQDVFTNSVMRVYTNTDIRGVKLCGALKNIIALATDISSGLGSGDNTKAALITHGLA